MLSWLAVCAHSGRPTQLQLNGDDDILWRWEERTTLCRNPFMMRSARMPTCVITAVIDEERISPGAVLRQRDR